jgi:hypothetical protein
VTQPVSTLTPEERLRDYLGERIPTDGVPEDTFFDDNRISDLLEQAGGIVLLAAYRGWIQKTSHLARLIDVDEQGSARKLSQRYRNAMQQTQLFQKMYEEFQLQTVGAARVAGRSVAWAKPDQCSVPDAFYFEVEQAVLLQYNWFLP